MFCDVLMSLTKLFADFFIWRKRLVVYLSTHARRNNSFGINHWGVNERERALFLDLKQQWHSQNHRTRNSNDVSGWPPRERYLGTDDGQIQ